MPVGESLGNRFAPGQEPALIAMAHEIPYVADRDRRRAARLRGQGTPARWTSARHATSTSSCPARSAGGHGSAETIRMARLAKETGLFPVFEAEQRRGDRGVEDPPAAAGRGVPEAADALRRTCSSRPATRRWSRACSSSRIATSPLRAARHGGHGMKKTQAVCDHARSGLEPRQPARARGAPCVRIRRSSAALHQRLSSPARTSRAGCSTPRPATTRKPGACSRATTRCPRRWPGLLPPVRIGLQSQRARRVRRHQRHRALPGRRGAAPSLAVRAPAAASGKKVLVVGAGPSGLSAAYHLRRMGHAVTVREAGPVAGGMMRFGIPKYRPAAPGARR